jgi:hypothetical protein
MSVRSLAILAVAAVVGAQYNINPISVDINTRKVSVRNRMQSVAPTNSLLAGVPIKLHLVLSSALKPLLLLLPEQSQTRAIQYVTRIGRKHKLTKELE